MEHTLYYNSEAEYRAIYRRGAKRRCIFSIVCCIISLAAASHAAMQHDLPQTVPYATIALAFAWIARAFSSQEKRADIDPIETIVRVLEERRRTSFFRVLR